MQNQVKTLWRKAGSNDWLSVVMIGLLGFMAWLSYDFVRGMLPPEMGILSVGGLIGLGLGAVLWERAYHTAKSEPQEELAKIMVWVNLSGEGLAFLGEVLRTGRVVIDLPAIMSTITVLGVIGIIAGNVFARFRYSQIDPEKAQQREAHRRAAEMTERQAQLAAQMEQAQFEAQLAEQEAEIEILRQQAAFTRQNSLGLAAERGEIQASNYLRQIRRANGGNGGEQPPTPFGTTPTKAKSGATSTPTQR